MNDTKEAKPEPPKVVIDLDEGGTHWLSEMREEAELKKKVDAIKRLKRKRKRR